MYYIESADTDEKIYESKSFDAAEIKDVIVNRLQNNPAERLLYYKVKDKADTKYVGDHLLGVYENRKGKAARILTHGYKYLT